ncbi:MAG: TIGR04255 family protein [Thermoflexales bacterium]|nr:TIGR04255 family protein [Thermoflexales bacterium]
MSAGRKYAQPPVVEAVCQFVLSADTPWDITVPGLFYEKLKDEFPYHETRIYRGVGIRVPEQDQPQFLFGEEPVLALFSESRTMLVQLGPRVLTVNCLKSYPTWPVFRSKIERAWFSLKEVLEIKGLELVRLQYINQIKIPEFPEDLQDCFTIYPHFGPLPVSNIVMFIVGALLTFHDGRDRCRLQLNNPSEEERQTVILDIEYSLTRPGDLGLEAIPQWLEEAHDRIENIFESSITDRLRTTFQLEA